MGGSTPARTWRLVDSRDFVGVCFTRRVGCIRLRTKRPKWGCYSSARLRGISASIRSGQNEVLGVGLLSSTVFRRAAKLINTCLEALSLKRTVTLRSGRFYLFRFLAMGKIFKIEYFRVPPRWLFVKITDDAGNIGWGEASLEGHTQAVEGCLDSWIAQYTGMEAKLVAYLAYPLVV